MTLVHLLQSEVCVCSYKWPSLGILLSSTIEAFPQKDSGPFFSQPSPKINISSFAFQEFPQPFFADRLFTAIPSVPQEWSEDFALGISPLRLIKKRIWQGYGFHDLLECGHLSPLIFPDFTWEFGNLTNLPVTAKRRRCQECAEIVKKENHDKSSQATQRFDQGPSSVLQTRPSRAVSRQPLSRVQEREPRPVRIADDSRKGSGANPVPVINLYDSCRELLSLPPKKSSGSEKPKTQERAG